MNDDLLSKFREEPDPDFSRRLKQRLDRIGATEPESSWFASWRFKPALASGLALAVVGVLLSIPAVRAGAQEFLDLFRVKRFVALEIDPGRLAELRSKHLDVETLLADRVERLTTDAPPTTVASVDDAARMTGDQLLVPTYVFNVADAPEISVTSERAARITADAERLQNVLDVLGIEDVRAPEHLDGARVTVRIPSAVTMRYRRGDRWVATFTQARSPEIDLPQGVDMRQLGEIGLRIAGLSPAEARQFASTIDWRSTVLVPVPANAGSFREVDVHGVRGLLLAVDGDRVETNERGEAPRSILLWSEGGMVYALSGTMHPVDLLEMANSLRNA